MTGCMVCEATRESDDVAGWRIYGITRPVEAGPLRREAGSLFVLCPDCALALDSAIQEAYLSLARRSPHAAAQSPANLGLVGVLLAAITQEGVMLDPAEVANFRATYD